LIFFILLDVEISFISHVNKTLFTSSQYSDFQEVPVELFLFDHFKF